MTAPVYWHAAGFCIQIETDDSTAFSTLLSPGSTTTDFNGTVDARLVVKKVSALPRPQRGAVCTRTLGDGNDWEFRHGRTLFDRKSEVFATVRDHQSFLTQVFYTEPSPQVAKWTRNTLKWLIIALHQASGGVYLHASAVLWKNKVFLFSGHSGSGKSSCLARAVQLGAEVLTDDTVLIRDGTLFPFDCFPSQKGDFEKRFPDFRPKPTDHESIPLNELSLLFPRVWTGSGSVLRPLTPEAAWQEARAIYLKETRHNSIPLAPRELKARLAPLCTQAAAWEFLTAKDEHDSLSALSMALRANSRQFNRL